MWSSLCIVNEILKTKRSATSFKLMANKLWKVFAMFLEDTPQKQLTQLLYCERDHTDIALWLTMNPLRSTAFVRLVATEENILS